MIGGRTLEMGIRRQNRNKAENIGVASRAVDHKREDRELRIRGDQLNICGNMEISQSFA
jgi:hypothetical protein